MPRQISFFYKTHRFRKQRNKPALPVLFLFFPAIPSVNIHTAFDFGQTMPTEQKMLSSEGVFIRRKQKEICVMKNNNQINVPQAREAMDRFKMQAASDEDVSSTS